MGNFQERFNNSIISDLNSLKEKKRSFCTSLLDLTKDPLVALYFACSNYNQEGSNVEDGYVICYYNLANTSIEEYENGILGKQKREWEEFGGYKLLFDFVEDPLKVIKNVNRLVPLSNENIELYYDKLRRLVLQHGEFLMMGRDSYNQSTSGFFTITIDGSFKNDILRILNQVYNISKDRLFLEYLFDEKSE